jgi:hypothetical protein
VVLVVGVLEQKHRQQPLALTEQQTQEAAAGQVHYQQVLLHREVLELLFLVFQAQERRRLLVV